MGALHNDITIAGVSETVPVGTKYSEKAANASQLCQALGIGLKPKTKRKRRRKAKSQSPKVAKEGNHDAV
jgi:hypothetical protein